MKQQEIKMGFQWYKSLTKKQQKQWRKNCLNYPKNNLKHFYNSLNVPCSLEDFIFGSFVFSNTPQGAEYWINIANKNK